MAAGASVLAFFRWTQARRPVAWFEDPGRIDFIRGRTVESLDVRTLDRVEVCPSAVRTKLTAVGRTIVLSHRLLRVELLLDRLRARRPDLFPEPDNSVNLRYSKVGFAFTVLLAAGAGLAGALVFPWGPWAGGVFYSGGFAILVRALLFVPLGCTVSPAGMVIRYLLRKKNWGRTNLVREDGYAAGGAVFFRMHLHFGNRTVVLDEGSLTDPLRPLAGWIARQLAF